MRDSLARILNVIPLRFRAVNWRHFQLSLRKGKSLRNLYHEALAKSDELSLSLAKLTQEHSAMAATLEQVTQERDHLLEQSTRVAADRNALSETLTQVTVDRNALSEMLTQVATDRDMLNQNLLLLHDEQSSLSSLIQQLAGERDQFAQDSQQLNQESDTLLAGFVQTYIQLSPAFNTLNRETPAPSSADRHFLVNLPADLNPAYSAQLDQMNDLLLAYETPLNALAVSALIPDTHDDVYRNVIWQLYKGRLSGRQPGFWELRIALNVLSRVLHPRTYLEVGTRVGWSLAQVLFHTPTAHCLCLDLWIENYAALENPGPEFVRAQMQRIIPAGMTLDLTFVTGNSHDTLVELFDPNTYPPGFQLETAGAQTAYDLITVDGDHSLTGAWMDLVALFPRVALGGAIVFDDLELSIDNSDIGIEAETKYPGYYPPMPSGLRSLRDVWNAMKQQYPNFVYIETDDHQNAVGIGLRVF